MSRLRRVTALVALLVLLPAYAAAQGGVLIAGSATPAELDLTPDQEQYLLQEYWNVARRYLTPDSATAVREMAAWTIDRIGKVQSIQYQPERALPSHFESQAEWSPRMLRAAAMLHTDVALEAFRQRGSTAFEFHTRIADGWLALADNRRSEPGGVRARWNAGVAGLMVASGELALAERWLTRVSDQIPGDPGLLLLSGIAREAYASRVLAQGSDGRAVDPAVAASVRRAGIDAASGFFERALAADPGLVEARVRLARVRTLQGRDAEADALLTSVLAGAPAPPSSLKYVACLILGAIRERAGDPGAAARLYVEAAQAEPDGQSAYLALAQVMYAVNQRDDAATVLDRLFGRGIVGAGADPWWLYPLGLDPNQEKRFDDIRADVRK